MTETSVTLFLGLVTIVGSGITSTLVTHRLTRAHNQTIFLREKAEALYLAMHEFDLNFSKLISSYYPLFEGRYDYNGMLDTQLSCGCMSNKYGAENMEMMVDIYFPIARVELEKVLSIRDEFSELMDNVKLDWEENGCLLTEWKMLFDICNSNMQCSIDALKIKVVQAARTQSGVKQ